MNNNEVTVKTGQPATKTTLTITRAKLWHNYAKCWQEMVDFDSDDKETTESYLQMLAESVRILCTGKLDYRIRKFFRDGNTCLMLDDLMQFIDLPEPARDNTLLEIVVVDGDERVVVDHTDIVF